MSTGYQIDDQYGMYFLTFTVVDWVDVFTRKPYRDIVIDSLNYCTVIIISDKFFRQKLEYIHQNPLRAGWVEREEDYLYSSAKALFSSTEGSVSLSYW